MLSQVLKEVQRDLVAMFNDSNVFEELLRGERSLRNPTQQKTTVNKHDSKGYCT